MTNLLNGGDYTQKNNLIPSKKIHCLLGIKKDYTTWIKTWIKNFNYKENVDYFKEQKESTGGRPSIEYLFTKNKIQAIVWFYYFR